MAERIGLLDLGDDYKEVEVRPGRAMWVHGLTAEDIFYLLRRFPPLMDMLDPARRSSITAEDVMLLAPGALAAIIAASDRKLNDPDAERNARHMAISIQNEIVQACLELTFAPVGGFGPFVASLTRTFEGLGLKPRTNGLDTKSPSPSNSSLTKATHEGMLGE